MEGVYEKQHTVADYTLERVYTGREAMYVGDIMRRGNTHMEENKYGEEYVRKKLHTEQTTNDGSKYGGHRIR